MLDFLGGAGRARTDGLLNAIQKISMPQFIIVLDFHTYLLDVMCMAFYADTALFVDFC